MPSIRRRNLPTAAAVAGELEPLARAARNAGIPQDSRLTNSYLLAHRVILDATLQYQRSMGINEPIDIIVDIRGRA